MDEWDELLLGPIQRHWPVILASCVFWFIAMRAVHIIFSSISGKYRAMSKEDQNAFAVRIVAVVHAFISWATIPGYIDPTPEVIADPLYGPHDTSERTLSVFFAITTGYFLWDIIVSIYYGWGAAFIMHAFSSFGVFYFGMRPFLPYHGCFYLGVFEISTPWLHLRGALEQLDMSGTLVHTITGVLFFVTFTTVRIIMGFYVSFFWWLDLIALMKAGAAHSNAVVLYYLFANGILMSLQAYWFVEILRAIVGGGGDDDKKKQ